MQLNRVQQEVIFKMLMEYNTDEKERTEFQNLYDNNPEALSMLAIYALEEILRYGNKGIFKKFLNTIKGENTVSFAIDTYDNFIKFMFEDDNFRHYKFQQFNESPESLCEMELLFFDLSFESLRKKEKVEELTYAELNPILYDNDKQIRDTVKNLFWGQFIYHLLETPGMKSVKDRQKDGRIADIDRQIVLDNLCNATEFNDCMNGYRNIIDERFMKARMGVLLGKGEEAFGEYLKYNTNISYKEIHGLDDEPFEQEIRDFIRGLSRNFKDSKNNKKDN